MCVCGVIFWFYFIFRHSLALDSLEKHRGNNSPLFVSVQNLLLINKLHLQQKSKVKEGRSTSSELKISDDDLVNINEFLMCLLS